MNGRNFFGRKNIYQHSLVERAQYPIQHSKQSYCYYHFKIIQNKLKNIVLV